MIGKVVILTTRRYAMMRRQPILIRTDDETTTMLLRNVHERLFNVAFGILVCSNSFNVLFHEHIATLFWVVSLVNIGLLNASFVPTLTNKAQTVVLGGQIGCHLLFALVIDAERLRLHACVSIALTVRLVDRLSSRQRSLQTDLGTRIDILNERIRDAGRRYKVGSVCLLLSLGVVFVSVVRVSVMDIFKSDLRGQLAKTSLQSHVGMLVVVAAIGACDTRSIVRVPFVDNSSGFGKKRVL